MNACMWLFRNWINIITVQTCKRCIYLREGQKNPAPSICYVHMCYDLNNKYQCGISLIFA